MLLVKSVDVYKYRQKPIEHIRAPYAQCPTPPERHEDSRREKEGRNGTGSKRYAIKIVLLPCNPHLHTYPVDIHNTYTPV